MGNAEQVERSSAWGDAPEPRIVLIGVEPAGKELLQGRRCTGGGVETEPCYGIDLIGESRSGRGQAQGAQALVEVDRVATLRSAPEHLRLAVDLAGEDEEERAITAAVWGEAKRLDAPFIGRAVWFAGLPEKLFVLCGDLGDDRVVEKEMVELIHRLARHHRVLRASQRVDARALPEGIPQDPSRDRPRDAEFCGLGR